MTVLATRPLHNKILQFRPDLFWPLNADYGVTDQSGFGSGKNGTAVGSPTLGGGVSQTYDSSDSSTTFNGSSQYITSSYSLPTVGTIVWIQERLSTASDAVIMSDSSSSGDYIYDDNIGADLLWGGNASATIGYNAGMSTKMAIAVAWDTGSDGARAYINGAPTTTNDVSITGASLSGNFWLGATNRGGSANKYFNGRLSYVAIFPRRLTSVEINQIAFHVTNIREPAAYVRQRVMQLNPLLYWPMNQYWYANAIAGDASGNNWTGTQQGTMETSPSGQSLSFDPADKSIDFDGTDDSLRNISIDPFVTGSARTFCGLASRDNNNNADSLFGGDNTTYGPGLNLVSAGEHVTWTADKNSGTYVTWSNAWPATTAATAFALTFNETANTAALHLNGSLVSSQSHTINYSTPGDFFVGSAGGINFFNGKISHVCIFGSILTDTQITVLHNAMLKGPPGVIIEAGG